MHAGPSRDVLVPRTCQVHAISHAWEIWARVLDEACRSLPAFCESRGPAVLSLAPRGRMEDHGEVQEPERKSSDAPTPRSCDLQVFRSSLAPDPRK